MKNFWSGLLLGCLLWQEPAELSSRSLPEQRFAAALRAYQDQDFATAYAGFAELLEAAPPVRPELRQNTALAALQLQRAEVAERIAREWLTVAAPAEQAAAQFLLGLAAWQRAERAAAAAQLMDAEPMAWQIAQDAAASSVEHFLQAAGSRGQWPAALRNAERAARWLRELQQQAAAQSPPPPKQEAEPPPDQPPPPDQQPEEQPPAAVTDPLSAAEAARLLERLQQRERQKRLLRQQQQRAATTAGEQDW